MMTRVQPGLNRLGHRHDDAGGPGLVQPLEVAEQEVELLLRIRVRIERDVGPLAQRAHLLDDGERLVERVGVRRAAEARHAVEVGGLAEAIAPRVVVEAQVELLAAGLRVTLQVGAVVHGHERLHERTSASNGVTIMRNSSPSLMRQSWFGKSTVRPHRSIRTPDGSS